MANKREPVDLTGQHCQHSFDGTRAIASISQLTTTAASRSLPSLSRYDLIPGGPRPGIGGTNKFGGSEGYSKYSSFMFKLQIRQPRLPRLQRLQNVQMANGDVKKHWDLQISQLFCTVLYFFDRRSHIDTTSPQELFVLSYKFWSRWTFGKGVSEPFLLQDTKTSRHTIVACLLPVDFCPAVVFLPCNHHIIETSQTSTISRLWGFWKSFWWWENCILIGLCFLFRKKKN